MKNKILFLLIGSLAYSVANATLGQSSTTINQDLQVLNSGPGKVSLQSANSKPLTLEHTTKYEVYTFTIANDIIVKQYVANKKVFAIVWRGPRIPNLRQLYGTYFNDYVNTKAANLGMSQRAIGSDELIATVYGVSGAYIGRAILKSQMPANVTLQDLK